MLTCPQCIRHGKRKLRSGECIDCPACDGHGEVTSERYAELMPS